MGELLECPLCGGMHAIGTTFCDVMWADIPLESANQEHSEDCAPQAQTDITRECICQCCGAPGAEGEDCWQCGAIIAVSPEALLRFPGAVDICIPCGEAVVIGRESANAAVSSAAMPYDTISRKHCSISIDPNGAYAKITDLSSTNGTRIVGSETILVPNEPFQVELPVQLGLGKSVTVDIVKR